MKLNYREIDCSARHTLESTQFRADVGRKTYPGRVPLWTIVLSRRTGRGLGSDTEVVESFAWWDGKGTLTQEDLDSISTWLVQNGASEIAPQVLETIIDYNKEI